MPLIKRVLYDPSEYHNGEVFKEAASALLTGNIVPMENRNMSSVLGVLNQLSSLSIYSLEIFHNLALLSEDVHDRVKILSLRTNTLVSKLPTVEKRVNSFNLEPDLVLTNGRSVYLRNREMLTPSLFIKKTNYSSISLQYKMCKPLPQLWRIETYIRNDEDCFKKYSYPGYFFQEWLNTEVLNQQQRKVEKKLLKALKKQAKNERRKQREIAYLEDTLRQSSGDAQDVDGAQSVKSVVEQLSDEEDEDDHTKKKKKIKNPFKKAFKSALLSKDKGSAKEVTTDDNASVLEDSSVNNEKKKKNKVGKAVSKIAGVFGLKKDKTANGKTDDEEEDSENDVINDNASVATNTNPNAAARFPSPTIPIRPNYAPPEPPLGGPQKKNTISNLFNNFTNKDNEPIVTVSAPKEMPSSASGGVN
jgi:hypothetical protein